MGQIHWKAWALPERCLNINMLLGYHYRKYLTYTFIFCDVNWWNDPKVSVIVFNFFELVLIPKLTTAAPNFIFKSTGNQQCYKQIPVSMFLICCQSIWHAVDDSRPLKSRLTKQTVSEGPVSCDDRALCVCVLTWCRNLMLEMNSGGVRDWQHNTLVYLPNMCIWINTVCYITIHQQSICTYTFSKHETFAENFVK